MNLAIDLNSIEGYRLFLKVKALPVHSFQGREAWFPDEYASRLGLRDSRPKKGSYSPSSFLFDYQAAIATTAIQKRKYAVFADCGLGKSLIYLEWIRHVNAVMPKSKAILMVCPLMVCRQMVAEAKRFYGDSLPIEQIAARNLPEWLRKGSRIGITNYEALTEDLTQGRLGALVADESSMLKSHYGAWGTRLVELGKGLSWKLAGTGTPAPNDRIEYAQHAVFLDQAPTINSFLAKYFVNRGQTNERWEMKPHALRPFYKSLSHWCIFLTNPSVYGWKDNCGSLPPIHTHIEEIDLTDAQRDAAQLATGDLFGAVGGIGSRGKVAQIAKGVGVESLKPKAIVERVRSFADESTIVWCKYNPEQDTLSKLMPDAGNIDGSTSLYQREEIISAFQRGEIKVLISKPRILGLGLNLQIATRMVFSTLQDSYEEYYQAVKRANRYGAAKPLNVHIPITYLERPMLDTVLRKATRVQSDAAEQERLFREMSFATT